MTPGYDFDLVCIGSGPAGQRAAVQAAKLGKRAAVVEKQRCIGGVCIDTGTIPSKTLREAVVFYSGLTGRAEHRRWVTAPRVSAEMLLARIEEVCGREIEVVEDQLRRNDVELVRGTGAFADPHTLVVDSGNGWRKLTAANVVVAVGTCPAPPPGVAADGTVVLTTDDVIRLEALPRTMAVIGGGVIGIEYASMFAALGVRVTLVERREDLLEFLDREIVEDLIHQMRDHNVTFRLGEAVESIEVTENPRQARLKLESGKRIVTDTALFSAGRTAVTAALNLPAAGLTADGRGRLK